MLCDLKRSTEKVGLRIHPGKTKILSDNKYNKSWIKSAKDRGRWTLLENDYTMTAEERSENNARHRNSQSRPTRYVNGVRLSHDEVPTSHNTKSKKRSNIKNEAIWKAAAPRSAPCMSQSCRHKEMFEKRNNPEHPDGLMIKNFVMLPWLPSFCCTESEDSSDFEFSEFIPATACV